MELAAVADVQLHVADAHHPGADVSPQGVDAWLLNIQHDLNNHSALSRSRHLRHAEKEETGGRRGGCTDFLGEVELVIRECHCDIPSSTIPLVLGVAV